MKGPQIDGLDKESLTKLYVNDECATLESVAATIGCNRETVRRWMKRYGLPIRPRGSTGKPRLVEAQPLGDRQWLEEQMKTKTQKRIANELGVSHSLVAHWVGKHKLWDARSLKKSEAVKRGLAKRYADGRAGDKASNWKGGRRVADGYIYLYVPNHPSATSNKPYVQEHRLVMEDVLGRFLESDEVVHHKDGNRQNNEVDNLEVKSRGRHLHEHFKASHDVLLLREENAQLLQRIAELEERLISEQKRD